MLKKLRARLEEIRCQKRQSFDDFQPLIKRIATTYAPLFPNFKENKDGSHYVYHFGIENGFAPFTVVKEHGGRDCQSPKNAKRIVAAIKDVLDFIELKIPDDPGKSEGDLADERTNGDNEKEPGALPEPEVSS